MMPVFRGESMEGVDPNQLTLLLNQVRQGEDAARSRLFSLVYPELKRIATAYMRRERKDHTLQATALVNEAFMRIAGTTRLDWQSRAHFFATAAHIMRQILVDHARQYSAEKRGGSLVKLELQDWLLVREENFDLILGVEALLEKLERLDGRQFRVVELRFYAGMTEQEIAEVLGISTRTVKRDWEMAKAWLQKQLSTMPRQ
jgi:RNA polymerase sigma factor (TIGR02999 family)